METECTSFISQIAIATNPVPNATLPIPTIHWKKPFAIGSIIENTDVFPVIAAEKREP